MAGTLEILILVTLDVSEHKSDITKESGYSQIGYSNTQQFLAPLVVSADAISDLHYSTKLSSEGFFPVSSILNYTEFLRL